MVNLSPPLEIGGRGKDRVLGGLDPGPPAPAFVCPAARPRGTLPWRDLVGMTDELARDVVTHADDS